MPESGTYGSVRGALSNGRPYRDGTSRSELPTYSRYLSFPSRKHDGYRFSRRSLSDG
jgi:hypothetical protein